MCCVKICVYESSQTYEVKGNAVSERAVDLTFSRPAS